MRKLNKKGIAKRIHAARRSFIEGARQVSDELSQVTTLFGNTASAQGSVVKYGQLPDSGKTYGLYIFSPSFAATIIKHAIRQSEREVEGVINTVLQIPKVLSLATLLDSSNGGGDLGPSNQSPADDAMKRKRKKKRRRGLGL